MNTLPETGFLRLKQIIGNPKATPPIPPLYPVGRTSWLGGVKDGRYPQPVKLGPKTTAWRVEDIKALIETKEGLRAETKNQPHTLNPLVLPGFLASLCLADLLLHELAERLDASILIRLDSNDRNKLKSEFVKANKLIKKAIRLCNGLVELESRDIQAFKNVEELREETFRVFHFVNSVVLPGIVARKDISDNDMTKYQKHLTDAAWHIQTAGLYIEGKQQEAWRSRQ